jgi:site-specific recombinase XerD
MLFRVYADPALKERIEHSWLKKEIEDYLDHLGASGYRPTFVVEAARQLVAFGRYAAPRCDQQLARLPMLIRPFIKRLHRKGHHLGRGRSTVARFVRHVLNRAGIATGRSAHLQTEVVDDYALYLKEQQGLRPGTIRRIRKKCEHFLAFLEMGHRLLPTAITTKAILDFIVAEGKCNGRTTLASICSLLRRFLSYLHRRGLVGEDYSSVVVSPRVFRHERCPRFLTRAEVEAALGVIDRRTAVGRRDHAMLLVLATYGLRGGEVVRLRLEDLNWRKQTLHIIRRKAGNETTYPLSVPVGEAILNYLRDGRPSCTFREVFLTSSPPFFPFHNSSVISDRARWCLVRAGIKVNHPGSHTFRYSCAQRLFEEGASLKMIGDYLGHRDPDSTQHYTKMALDQLREVALSDGEDLL